MSIAFVYLLHLFIRSPFLSFFSQYFFHLRLLAMHLVLCLSFIISLTGPSPEGTAAVCDVLGIMCLWVDGAGIDQDFPGGICCFCVGFKPSGHDLCFFFAGPQGTFLWIFFISPRVGSSANGRVTVYWAVSVFISATRKLFARRC